ncbi:amidohydrolase family protein [bacterium]|nr:amidohydrolase family protein [bacterium]
MPNPDCVLLSDNLYGRAPGQLAAVWLSGGRIHSLRDLSAAEASQLLDSSEQRCMDLRGRLVLPGLIDAHVHAIATGLLYISHDVRGISTLAELEAAIRAEAAKGTDVVRLGGLDRSKWSAEELAPLCRAWLDAMVPERPLFIKSIEGHSAWFNSLAWERIGVGPKLAELKVEGAAAQQMWDSGRVYGETYEELTSEIYDSYSFEERRSGMLRVLEEARRVGLTGIHCLEGYGAFRRHDFEMILELDGQGCDLTLYARDEDPRLAAEMQLKRFGGCWCVDGAIGAHTAAISQPYADKPESCGELFFSDAQLEAWIEAGLSRGMQVCNHAIGDVAIGQAIRVYEGLAARHDLQASRPRVDHFVLGSEDQAHDCARLGLCCAMQPAFDAYWGGESGAYASRLGAKRAIDSNPVGMAVRAGMKIAGSSDAYITPLDPLAGLRAAMYHHNPAHRVDFDTAVQLFTENAAYLAHQDDTRGKIAMGYQADFTVVDGDRSLLGSVVSSRVKNGVLSEVTG